MKTRKLSEEEVALLRALDPSTKAIPTIKGVTLEPRRNNWSTCSLGEDEGALDWYIYVKEEPPCTDD